MPQARDSIERAGRLRLHSITPDGSCLWQCLALAINPQMSFEDMDLNGVYLETQTAFIRLRDRAKLTTPLTPLPDLNYIWEPGQRLNQMKKSKATGEYQDIVALAWHLEIRVVMWCWNVAEGAFERNVTVVDFRQHTDAGPTIRGSMCSTAYILYVNAGASFKDGACNHYELLYPLPDTELK